MKFWSFPWFFCGSHPLFHRLAEMVDHAHPSPSSTFFPLSLLFSTVFGLTWSNKCDDARPGERERDGLAQWAASLLRNAARTASLNRFCLLMEAGGRVSLSWRREEPLSPLIRTASCCVYVTLYQGKNRSRSKNDLLPFSLSSHYLLPAGQPY